MLTFKEFLAESRTKVVDIEAFIRWADKNAGVYMHGPHFLYRGGSGDAKKGLRIGDSAGSDVRPRESANTYNNYTLWIDNDPAFNGWPKRSLSWIGTDDWDVAEQFGGAALLIIDDEAKIGIVGQNDLWETPLDIPGRREITIEELNGWTQHYFHQKKKQVKTYEQLVEALKSITADDLEDEDASFDGQFKDFMTAKKLNNLYDVWKELVVPKIFAKKTTGALVGNARSDGEVWIQGTVGFIPHISRLSNAEAQRLTEWADQYPELHDELQTHWSKIGDDHWG